MKAVPTIAGLSAEIARLRRNHWVLAFVGFASNAGFMIWILTHPSR